MPKNGLAVARMAAHITYLSEEALHRKFGRSLQDRSALTFSFNADFQVESYLRHQGSTFVDRFDANSYLYITRAMDYFDMRRKLGGVLANAFRGTRDALLRRLVHVRLAVSDARKPRDRAGVECRRRQRLVRRDRERQGPRRVPAGGADVFRDHARLSQCRGGEARPRGGAGDGDMNAARRSAMIVGEPKAPRVDHVLIAEMVEAGSRVLDVGCGDGELLQLLAERKGVDGRGVELQRDKVNACVARGLSVIQGDADRDLDDYPDQAFDYAILSLTIQATRQPKTVLENLLADRPARHRVVSEFRPLAGSHAAAVRRAACRSTTTCRTTGI